MSHMGLVVRVFDHQLNSSVSEPQCPLPYLRHPRARNHIPHTYTIMICSNASLTVILDKSTCLKTQ